jgi:quercetin dioxygenase-like cupin family protein
LFLGSDSPARFRNRSIPDTAQAYAVCAVMKSNCPAGEGFSVSSFLILHYDLYQALPKEEQKMSTPFPGPILQLPEADIPLPGLKAYLSQGPQHQILFMTFEQDALIPEHSHESQWGVVLEGRADFIIAGKPCSYSKGDRYFISSGTKHSVKIHAGYADITYFNQADRYAAK